MCPESEIRIEIFPLLGKDWSFQSKAQEPVRSNIFARISLGVGKPLGGFFHARGVYLSDPSF